jgi:PadR family transcriptional regulator, regulatory protein PadR
MLVVAMPRRTELLPGTLEMLILRTLDVQPMHGYGIAQHIHRLSKEALTIEEGSLYPALQRMLVKGWVTAAWRTSETKRRTRVYTLTTAGRKQLGVAQENFNAMFAALARVMKG